MDFITVPDISVLVLQLMNGLTRAMILFIIASGLTLILGTCGIVNFFHGSLYMLGAYLCYSLALFLGNYWAALVLAPIAVAFLGGFIEVALLRRIYKADLLMQLLLTFALVLVASDVVRLVWGPAYKMLEAPSIVAGSISILGAQWPNFAGFILGLGPAVALGLWFFLYKTRAGRIVRAIALDEEIVSILGIDVRRVLTLVFMLGCLLAGFGGALQAPLVALNITMDSSVIVESFIVVVVGGLGSIWGALLGAVIIGVTHSFGIMIMPRVALVSIFVVMGIVLIVRPWGLMGTPLSKLAR